jgi:hypothetical protein
LSKAVQAAKSSQAQHATGRVAPLRLALPLFFVALPAILFYAILTRDLVNIPFYDEYTAALDFLNHLATINGTFARAGYFQAAQTNEYKLLLYHAFIWLEFSLTGHMDFAILSIVGNGFVLVLGIVLWFMFLPGHKDLAARITFFIPISWLLFQLQYWENLDWATAVNQHIAVLPLVFGAIYLLLRSGRGAFSFALLLLILSVAADANGVLLFPIGATILILGRHSKRLGAWLLTSAACVAFYAYHYTPRHEPPLINQAVATNPHRFNPAYVLAFMGSGVSFPFFAASLVLGTLLCLFFGYLVRRGYVRRNPVVSWCLLFLLITAVGVAVLRSGFGIAQAAASRYTIYSALFLIFAWFAIVEEFLQNKPASLFKNDILLCAVLLSISWSLSMDFLGGLQLGRRSHALTIAMRDYVHPASPGSQTGPSPPLLGLDVKTDPVTEAFNQKVRPILDESIKLGVYHPPPL